MGESAETTMPAAASVPTAVPAPAAMAAPPQAAFPTTINPAFDAAFPPGSEPPVDTVFRINMAIQEGRLPHTMEDWGALQYWFWGGHKATPEGWIRVWSKSRNQEYY